MGFGWDISEVGYLKSGGMLFFGWDLSNFDKLLADPVIYHVQCQLVYTVLSI